MNIINISEESIPFFLYLKKNSARLETELGD